MKQLIRILGAAAVIGGLAAFNAAFAQPPAQTTTTTTVTSRGTVTELDPDAIVVKTDTSTTPVRYKYTKTTTYVDENGNPVSVKTVTTGRPVTVYYDQNGNQMVAEKVVVRKSVTATSDPPPTTTTVVQQNGSSSANGIVSDSDSDSISIRTGNSSEAIHYKVKDAAVYVDENGSPTSRHLSEGTPVTINYERAGDQLVATRVVVRNTAAPTTTTTTVAPAY